jgi:hypothetical protein
MRRTQKWHLRAFPTGERPRERFRRRPYSMVGTCSYLLVPHRFFEEPHRVREELAPIEAPSVVGTSGQAVAALDAAVVVDDHDPAGTSVGGLDGTNRRAGRVLAVQARPRKEPEGDVRKLAALFLDDGAVHYAPGSRFSAMQEIVQA